MKMRAVSTLPAVQDRVTLFFFVSEAVQILFIQNTTIAIYVYEIIASFLFTFKNYVVLEVLHMTYT